MDSNSKIFGKFFKRKRQERDLSQEKAARLLHMYQTKYSKIETGNIEIDLDILFLFSEFYECDPADVIRHIYRLSRTSN
jgi:transcriptional regulator with XRE-family HTH domain